MTLIGCIDRASFKCVYMDEKHVFISLITQDGGSFAKDRNWSGRALPDPVNNGDSLRLSKLVLDRY